MRVYDEDVVRRIRICQAAIARKNRDLDGDYVTKYPILESELRKSLLREEEKLKNLIREYPEHFI